MVECTDRDCDFSRFIFHCEARFSAGEPQVKPCNRVGRVHRAALENPELPLSSQALLLSVIWSLPVRWHGLSGRAGTLASGRATCSFAAALLRPCVPVVTSDFPLTFFPLISNQKTISVGKYLVSPLSRRRDDGRYCASVSIRSGHGSASTDRVMRFTGDFDTENAAQSYANEQGLIWVSQSGQPARLL